jgi:galactoside O-acetyltransferase
MIIKLLPSEVLTWFEELLKYLPGYVGIMMRRIYCNLRLRSCGAHAFIGVGVTFIGARNIELGGEVILGANSFLGSYGVGRISVGSRLLGNRNVVISAVEGNITIGNNVLLGPNVVIVSDNHKYDRLDIPIRAQGTSTGEILIEDDVWIGANSVILPNVKIGRGSIIAAGAVVNRDISPNSIAGGVPAKIIRIRTDSSQ